MYTSTSSECGCYGLLWLHGINYALKKSAWNLIVIGRRESNFRCKLGRPLDGK